MNLKALFVVVLCLLSLSIIWGTAIATSSIVEEQSCTAFTPEGANEYLANSGVKPTGDPIGGDDWPQKG